MSNTVIITTIIEWKTQKKQKTKNKNAAPNP